MNKWVYLLSLVFSSHYIFPQLSVRANASPPKPAVLNSVKKEPITIDQSKTEFSKNYKQIKVKTRDWGPDFSPLESLFGRATQDRKELDELRQKNIERYFEMRESKNPDFASLAQDITEETIAYVKKRIIQTIIELGPPPTDFSIFSMGSMARQESGFYTDLEIGILVKEKNVKVIKYFQRFAQKLSDRFFLLGEHPDVGGKGLRMDEADNSPAHLKFFARYACEEQTKSLLKSALEKREFDKIPFEGSRIFIATPDEFAQHVNPNFLTEQEKVPKDLQDQIFKEEFEKALADPVNKEKSEAEVAQEVKANVKILLNPLNPREKQISGSVESLVRNIRYIYGDNNLFNEYLKKREVYLNGAPKYNNPFYSTRREEIAFLEMKKDLIKYMNKPESSIVMGKLGKEIDIKRELYRFPEQILTNLGFWFDVGEQNTIKIAQLLVQKGVISSELSNRLIDMMNYFIGLRFKKQSVCRKQTHAMPTTQEEFEEQKTELEQDLQKLKKQREFMVQSNSPASDLEKIDKDISKIQNSLIDLRKLKPLEESSILSATEINLLNTKYLPLLKELFQAAQSFIQGNKKAFLQVKLKPRPLPPLPMTREKKIISQSELEQMIINNQTDLIVDALLNGRTNLKLVTVLAIKNKKVEEISKIQQELTKKMKSKKSDVTFPVNVKKN